MRKRKRAEIQEQCDELSPKKRVQSNGSFLSYAEFLSEIYRIIKEHPANENDHLSMLAKKVFKKRNQHSGAKKTYLWLRMPHPDDQDQQQELIVTYSKLKSGEVLCFAPLENSSSQESCQFLQYKFSKIHKNIELHRKLSREAQSVPLLVQHLDSLVRLLKPSAFIDSAHLPHVRQENSLSLEEFKSLMADNENQSLVDKLFILNNGSLFGENDLPLWIEVKNGVSFRFHINVAPYVSNCLSKTNFSAKESVQYYEIKLIKWDTQQNQEHDKASAFIQIALDQGYGLKALPSELMWIQKEYDISGKEILAFLMNIFTFLKPKVVYLLDSAKEKDNELRIIRPVWKGRSFYQEYASFSLVETDSMLSHEEETFHQNQKRYTKAVQYLQNFLVSDLDSVVTKAASKIISPLLQKYPNARHLPQLLDELFVQNQNDFNTLTKILFAPQLSNLAQQTKFARKVTILNDARLWSRNF